MGNEGARMISELLKSNSTLTKLDLSGEEKTKRRRKKKKVKLEEWYKQGIIQDQKELE